MRILGRHYEEDGFHIRVCLADHGVCNNGLLSLPS
jgi:hypothetical protein